MLSRAKLVNIGEGRKSLFRKLAKKLLRIVTRPVVRGGRSRRVSKRIRPKILWRQYVTRNISKRIHSKILWRQFPPHLKKNPTKNSVEVVQPTVRYPPNLKKNPLQNSVEADSAISQKESDQIFGGGSPAESQKESAPKFCEGSTIRAISQKESAPNFCGGSSCQISKRIRPKILWR
jgi:hypothetical protein